MVLTCILVSCDDSQSVGWHNPYCRHRVLSLQNHDVEEVLLLENTWRAWLARMLSPNLSLQSCPRMENILRCSLEWGGSLPGGRWQVQELTNGVSVIVVGAHCDAGQWSSPPCWSAQGRQAQRGGQIQQTLAQHWGRHQGLPGAPWLYQHAAQQTQLSCGPIAEYPSLADRQSTIAFNRLRRRAQKTTQY